MKSTFDAMCNEIDTHLWRVLSIWNLSSEPNRLEELLGILSSLIAITTEESAGTVKLSLNDKHTIHDILKTVFDTNDESMCIMLLRVQRGLVIFLRNILINSFIDAHMIMECLCFYWKKILLYKTQKLQMWGGKLLNSYMELLANLLNRDLNFESINDYAETFLTLNATHKAWRSSEFLRPFTIFLKNWSTSADLSSHIMAMADTSLLDMLIESINQLQKEAKLSIFDEIFINIMFLIISHDSFVDFSLKYHKTQTVESFTAFIKACQLVLTSDFDLSRGINKYSDWTRSMLLLVTEETTRILDSATASGRIEAINNQTTSVLDIMSHIFQSAGCVAVDHKAEIVEILGRLLKETHQKCAVKSLRNESSSRREGVVYPNVKALCMENIGYLCFKDPKVQNKLREAHILEIILSNCIIDDYNPFLKEYSVICIKYALENNKKNQDLIANLEAKQVVDDSILEQTGYRAVIENGEIKLQGGE